MVASSVAFDKMRSKSVVVLVPPASRSSAPAPVMQALSDPALGGSIPRLAVFDPAVETKFGAMSYQQIKSGAKGFRDINRAIKEGMDGAGGRLTGGTEVSGSTGSALASRWDGAITGTGSRDWTSAAGTRITAEAVRFDGRRLTLRKADGKTLQVTMEQLDADSRTAAQALIDAAKAAAAE